MPISDAIIVETNEWLKGDIVIDFLTAMGGFVGRDAKDVLQAIAKKQISNKYFYGQQLRKGWIRDFKDEVSSMAHWITFEYLKIEVKEKEFKLDHEAECWLYLIGESY